MDPNRKNKIEEAFMMRNKYSYLILFLIGFCAHFSYADCSQHMDAEIQKLVDEYRLTNHIPGIEVSVSCPGEASPRDFVSGTTERDGDIAIQSNHLFQIGS